MFAGFAAITLAMQGQFGIAAIAIFVAMVLDTLDGRVARLTHTASEFGLHYDSLSDMLAFGIAPALILYEWSLQYMHPIGGEWATLGWLGAFFYIAAVALRLARFNVQANSEDPKFFHGLPSPAGAGLLISAMWVVHRAGYSGAEFKTWVLVATLLVSVLLVSRFAYYSFKETTPGFRVRMLTWLIILSVVLLFALDPPKLLLLGFGVYALTGPALYLRFLWRRHGKASS